jgi:hydroxyacylglutathione hydrolase
MGLESGVVTEAMETEVEPKEALPEGVEAVADGVYLMRGDLRGGMNVYFVRGPDGELIQYDAGTRWMTKKNVKAAQALGGLDRVILSHGHADHRGTAPGLGAPVHCHPDEVGDVRSPASITRYMDLSELDVAPIALLYRFLLPWWDGGPVEPDGTVREGDRVAGFEVIHFPGHAPGLIGLWRESDRVALVSDTVYLVDSARLKPLPEGEASVPHPAWAWDHAKAKESVRKLAELHPVKVLAGHGDPLDKGGEDLHDTLIEASNKF